MLIWRWVGKCLFKSLLSFVLGLYLWVGLWWSTTYFEVFQRKLQTPMSGIVVIYHIFWSISKKVANIHLLDSCLFFSFTSLHHPMSFDKGLCLYLYNSNTIELWNISTTPEISLMLEGICEGTLKGLFYCSGGWWEGDQPIGKGMSPWNQADLGKCLI